MTTRVDRATVVAALEAEWSAFGDLLDSLDEADWTRDTPCPGWRVHDVVAHVVGTERMLLGEAPSATNEDVGERPHLRNDIGRFNELWVQTLADLPSDDLLAMFRDVTARRREVLADMPDSAWDEVGFTPAGPDTHGRFMRIRVFDTWLHEQDVRDAVGRPSREDGDEVAVVLDEMETALGYVVGKLAGAPRGTVVTFELTGPQGRTRHVEVSDRAGLVDKPVEADATLTMPVGTFARLAGGRTTLDDVEVAVSGDERLGRQVLEHVNYTI